MDVAILLPPWVCIVSIQIMFIVNSKKYPTD